MTLRVTCELVVAVAGHSPLRGPGARGFRAVFLSRTVVYLGSQAAEVALLVQAQRLTGSPLVVGTLGLAELVPLILFGLYGGVLADRFDRRALMRWCEPGLARALVCCWSTRCCRIRCCGRCTWWRRR